MKKFSQIKKPINKVVKVNEDNYWINETNTDNTDLVEVGTEKSEIVQFFSKLFESREIAHIFHLQVRGEEGSYGAHKALGEYYEGVIELTDELIETYQGQYGIVDGYSLLDKVDSPDAISYFEGLVENIKHSRKSISDEDTHLHNIVDEIIALIYRTLYKLKFLK